MDTISKQQLTTRARGIIANLISNQYKDLKPILILSVKITKSKKFMARLKRILFFGKIELSGSDIKKMNDQALTGLIAHELSHFSGITNERETDTDVVKRGLGNELYELQKYHDKYYKKYNKSDGLTKTELRRILK